MRVERPQVGWGFWLRWVLASAIGFGISFIGAWGVLFLVLGYAARVGGFLVGAGAVVLAAVTVGASVGIAQWLALRRHLSRAGLWLLGSVVGMTMGLSLSVWLAVVLQRGGRAGMSSALTLVGVAGNFQDYVISGGMWWAVVGVVAGASVGIAQWLTLRNQLSWASLWPLGSVLGMAIGFPAGALVLGALGSIWHDTIRLWGADVGYIAAWAIGLAVMGAVSGAITGLALVWLLRHPLPQGRRWSSKSA